MSDIVIKVENLSKKYQLGAIGTGALTKDLNLWWHKVRGKKNPYAKIDESSDFGDITEHWAIKDVSFEIKQGDAVGIIGKNGAGKSTLLKILSRITTPTEGNVKIKGRIASLLEVGTGFNGELTGRENIYLNGAILGMSKAYINSRLDEIIAFSGVEKYIDTPVKRYSSGMYVRLAFAVAAHLEPEILIVDEVLAVGDMEFQKKCLGKMNDVSSKEGRTVLFVSHNMDAIINLCNSSIILQKGHLKKHGPTKEIVRQYLDGEQNGSERLWTCDISKPQPYFSMLENKLEQREEKSILKISFECVSENIFKPAFVAFDIRNSMRIAVMQALPTIKPFIPLTNTRVKYECEIDVTGLIPDRYFISPWIGPHYSETYDFPQDVIYFEILSSNQEGRTFGFNHDHGFFTPKSTIKQIN